MFLFTFWVAERVGRRKGLIWGSALGCIPMWYIGGYVMRKFTMILLDFNEADLPLQARILPPERLLELSSGTAGHIWPWFACTSTVRP